MRDEEFGVFKWEAFVTFATLIVPQAKRRGGALSLLLVGLDPPSAESSAGVRGLDETAVRVVAGVLQGTVRDGDLIGRHGPRSFAVLAQDAQEAGAIRLTQRIQALIGEHLPGGLTPAFTVSMGISTLPQAGMTLGELLRHAEQALAQAVAEGGNHARIHGTSAIIVQPNSEGPDALQSSVTLEMERERRAAQRRAALAHLMQAYRRGAITGFAVQTQPGACPACLDAARDLYRPTWIPTLPLAGCAGPVGCRCSFTSPALAPRWTQVPVPAANIADLDIPGRLQDAALFGTDPGRRCKPADLAEYMENFPLLWFEPDLDLQRGEIAFFQRPARRAWEHPTAASSVIHGPPFPLAIPFTGWVKETSTPPSISSSAVPYKDEGTLFFTNRRIIFRKTHGLDGIPLLEVTSIEYLRDAIACQIGDWKNRLVFFVKEPLLVGIYLARAVRLAALDR